MTQRTREIAERGLEGGLSPLDYMLDRLRDVTLGHEVRFEAAKAAAPYIHPRLAAIEANITGHITLGSALDALDD